LLHINGSKHTQPWVELLLNLTR